MNARWTLLATTLALCSACSRPAPESATPAAKETEAVAEPAATGYTPTAVFCADPAVSDLCSVIPSFIGPDPALKAFGYQGLSDQVTSPENDAQSPFDNMAWQMFVALNWQASQPGGDPATGLNGQGPVVWQSYARPEDVFGGPSGQCDNPKNLPRFNLIAKSAAQGSRDEEFLQATGQPLIDANGNWTLFERRLNEVEQNYLVSQGLTTWQGQKKFIQGGGSVLFPPGDSSKTNGAVGAIELKASWRILSPSEVANYFSIPALLDVEGVYVEGGQDLCAEVTLGLVGLHIIQANAELGALKPQFIWASFEHVGNAPLAAQACDPVDNNCYKNIPNNNCPAPPNAGNFSFYQQACSALPVNTPPQLGTDQIAFVWQNQPPYAGAYTTNSGGAQCGTQVARCWDIYDLTQDLNSAWQQQLSAIGSVFANYQLIGTNWGAAIEPEIGKLDNNAVPAFLGNSTMETYIQSDPTVGNCVGCHSFATLAYQSTDAKCNPVTYSANFSFLPGLATPKICTDINAGPIWNNEEAQCTCPKVCSDQNQQWNGQWTTTQPGVMSVCGCCG